MYLIRDSLTSGDRIAVTIGGFGDSTPDIRIYDVARGVANRWTFSPPASLRALWSGDGKQLVFARGSELFDVYAQASDGSGEARQLSSGAYRIPTSVSSDSSMVLVRQLGDDQTWDIGLIRVESTVAPEMILQTEFDEHSAVLSPNERFMAYVSDESGRQEIYVRAFLSMKLKTRVSVDGGTEPLWSRDGSEIFYRNGSAMMAVPVSDELSFAPGSPVHLFDGPFQGGQIQGSPNTNYDVSLDGKQFLMIQDAELASELLTRIEVVFNSHR